jgi:3D (Asp-Asp-Asp) domain-containing protein
MPAIRQFLILLLAFALTSCATATKPQAKTTGRKMTVRTTAYTAYEPGGAYAASGVRLHFGGASYSAAADWSWLPLGTRFRMQETGRTYVIEDYGSALVGKQTVDLFMPSGAAMRQWGCRTVNIEILEWGSKAMSLKMLEPRQRAGYVRKMVASLKKTPGNMLLAKK